MINRYNKETFWYFDHNDMCLEKVGGNGGEGDSVGRNAWFYICYPHETWLKESILRCIKQRDDSYIQFYRYPDKHADTISRDHVASIILAFWINRDKEELSWILHNLPWRLSRRYTQTVDMWIWIQTLKFRGWKHHLLAQIFYLITLFQFVLIVPWNFIIRTIFGLHQIKPNEVDKPHHLLPKKWGKIIGKLLYPHYALFNLVWQVNILYSGGPIKWLTNLLVSLDSKNPILKRVAGFKKLTQKDIDKYTPLSGFQWAGEINKTLWYGLPRKLSQDETKYNDLTHSIMMYLYYGYDKIMLKYDDKLIQRIKNGEKITELY